MPLPPWNNRVPWLAAAPLALLILLSPACGGTGNGAEEAGRELPAAALAESSMDPPARAGAFAPYIVRDGAGALLSWIETVPSQPGDKALDAQERHVLRFARLAAEGDGWSWSRPLDVVKGDDFFANWVDVPSVRRDPRDGLVAHWLRKSGGGTYSYDVHLARSTDGGGTWKELGPAHDDGRAVEHGFVSMVREGDALRLFWLDGREMQEESAGDGHGGHGEADAGSMTLRTALLDGARISGGEVLDPQVCECCSTDAVRTATGSLAVFRDRTPEEVRDIHVVRRTAGSTGTRGGWETSRTVHADGWTVPGCPVNGPALDAASGGKSVALAWFTAPDNDPRVMLAFSHDSGASFSKPARIDAGRPMGRVDLAFGSGGDAFVTWMESTELGAAVFIRRVPPAAVSLPPPLELVGIDPGRASGIPRLLRLEGGLLVVWTEAGNTPRLRARLLAEEDVPGS